ncbi:MAG: hypothetical protein GW906_01965 [Epsilonproteobacteria bacterium]|nr:hypothetical protein [Campylobacterota bacterium]OIO13227.1 MAG: hypothetical protein AUJ81_11785 [Helicobacteraceae bacterium CG1_02_36_14]PIP10444.1 MAG: hypothetical protein COX50_05745 [Sulfurimonas sp. CG23_combo_of_CG06-09_8_20_14_all_36_33]PIS26659.1 MAG: hypothetical protein COT46_01720 [Sulfurimonas sp. CG08_land_8_20_14_0_20_36_33]PIU33470.1 MAG: hypothetical protein COT05_12005 [Sulfurimonas sp. CG07_land_8_20_14_0_80_36_56]PIV04914.1 MAG: hypothetical protein COS56_03300 [Sulfur
MLEISKSIKALDNSDISDNIFHYEYNTKHLLSLIKKGIQEDDPAYLSSYRSFEGEVFENFIYEKLLRYAQTNEYIEKFVLKGYHQNKEKAYANTLSISEKQQIVYRTKSREISEFDAMFVTKNNELYFVEMTLVKSVLKLRKRLRKKKALLEIIFPNYVIKSLIILNEGATGTKQLPDYCKVWITKEFSAQDVMEYIKNPSSKKLEPIAKISSKKMIEAHTLKLHPFRYYNTMSWITKSIRAHKTHILDMNFLMNPNVQRYLDLYNKFYVGYLSIEEAKKMLDLKEEYALNQRVVVAIEKKHSDEIVVTYYIQKARKNLYLYSFDDAGVLTKEKKDPYGITVTEVYHASKMMDNSYELNLANIKLIAKLLKERYVMDLVR